MLCYFDPVRSNANEHVILNMSMKIIQLLNVMWQNKFGSKLDKIENPFSKRSLPLWCPKGKNIIIVLNDTLLFEKCPNWIIIFYISFIAKQVTLTDNTSESGLCVILYAAKLVQSAQDVLTKKGLVKLLHDMIKTNKDRSCLKQLRKDTTSLMLVLLEKYSSECFIDSLVDYPSVFHSNNDDTSDFGYSSNQASSLTNDTADSDWQQSEEKSNPTRSIDSVSDTSFSTYQNGLTSVYDAKHHSRSKSNYILDSASQDSNYQEQTWQNADECQEQLIKDSSEENREYEDTVCQGVPLVKGQFCAPIVGYFPFFEKYPHSDTCLCTGRVYDKIGRH